jgi:hypothetical protein
MGKVLLVGRLVARDLRHRPAQAVLLLLAITAAAATLTLGLALHGVTSQPYQQTGRRPTARTWWPSCQSFISPAVSRSHPPRRRR